MERSRSGRTGALSERAKSQLVLPEALCRYVSTGKQIMREGREFSSSNKDGIVIMSVSENSGNFSLLKDRLEVPRRFERDMILYPVCWSGRKELKIALKSYMEMWVTKTYDLKVDNLTIANGCGSLMKILGFCMCESGDTILIPEPFYPGFIQDLGRADVSLYGFKRSPENSIDTRELDRTLRCSARPVKALLLVNPDNPLGICYTIEELLVLVDWCRANKIHLISDEVYAQSQHSTDEQFISVSTALESREDRLGDWVHIVYSMSKDFSLAGERIGFYYGENPAILSAMQEYSEEHSVPQSVQRWATDLLQDQDFLTDYFIKSKRKLTGLYNTLSSGLDEIGIPFVKCSYGLFVWADFREFLPKFREKILHNKKTYRSSLEAERELWKYLIYEVGILFTPSEACCGEPGFMRICFAFGESSANVKIALDRLKKFVENYRNERIEKLENKL